MDNIPHVMISFSNSGGRLFTEMTHTRIWFWSYFLLVLQTCLSVLANTTFCLPKLMQLMNEPNTANATDPSKRRDERGLHQSAPFVQIAPAWNPSCHWRLPFTLRTGTRFSSKWKHRFHHLVKEGTNIAVPESTRLQHRIFASANCW